MNPDKPLRDAESLLEEARAAMEASGHSVEQIATRQALCAYALVRDCCGPRVALEWLLAVTSSALEVDG